MAGSKNDDRGSKVRKYVNREVTSEFCLFSRLDSNRLGNLFRTLVPIGKRCILWIQAEPSCCITWRFPFLVQFVCLFECFRPAVPRRAALFARTSVTLDFRIATTGPIWHVNKETRTWLAETDSEVEHHEEEVRSGRRGAWDTVGSCCWVSPTSSSCRSERTVETWTQRGLYTWKSLHYLIIVWLTSCFSIR